MAIGMFVRGGHHVRSPIPTHVHVYVHMCVCMEHVMSSIMCIIIISLMIDKHTPLLNIHVIPYHVPVHTVHVVDT